MPGDYDIAVRGATAAGYVSALLLAKAGHRVVVVDCPASRTESPLGDWFPADLPGACPVLKALRVKATEAPFRAVTFHSEALDRQATHRQSSPAGYFVRSARLLGVLASAARRAKVALVKCPDPPRMNLEESRVHLQARRQVAASLLLIAQGSPEEMAAELGLPGRVAVARMTACGLDVPLSGPVRPPLDAALHVVAFSAGGRLGMFFVAGRVLHVRIVSAATPAANVEALSGLLRRLQQAGLVPSRLDLRRAVAAIWHPPGGVALELETHVAKRTLLVGTASGFASALTGQTLDATIRSALVAAQVAGRALRSPRPQEVLADYKTQWRDVLAERIRPIGISLPMLMPMVLTNKAMTGRFARALLHGGGI